MLDLKTHQTIKKSFIELVNNNACIAVYTNIIGIGKRRPGGHGPPLIIGY